MEINFFLRIFSVFCLVSLLTPSLSKANSFHQLLKEKQVLERQFNLKTLECFPFIKKIGFTEDQVLLIKQCLKGTRTLKEAFVASKVYTYKTIGISSQFLKTAGFQTILIPWDATKDEVIQFLNKRASKEDQTFFLDKIHEVKQSISRNLRIKQFYCSQEISNEDCLAGYENLAAVRLPDTLKDSGWQEIIITRYQASSDGPGKLILGFQDSPSEMRKRLLKDPFKTWRPRQKMYEKIQDKYGAIFKAKLLYYPFSPALTFSSSYCGTKWLG